MKNSKSKEKLDLDEAKIKEFKILIVIQTYNNEKTLRNVVKESLKTGLDILIVNNGSTDQSIVSIKEFNIPIINFSQNKGKGAAIKAGGIGQKKMVIHI